MRKHDPYKSIIEFLRYRNSCETEEQFKERLRLTRPVMRDLRAAYKSCPCRVDYTDEQVRAAYLLGYYPYYIEILYEELSFLPGEYFPGSWANDSINACFFGGGPCPETIGWLAFLEENYPNIHKTNAFVFDLHSDCWKLCRGVTQHLVAPDYWDGDFKIHAISCDILDSTTICSKEASEAIESSNLFVLQNCFNDQPGSNDSYDNFDQLMNTLEVLITRIPYDSILIIADLIFPRTKDLIINFEEIVTNKQNAVILRTINREKVQIKPNIESNKILDELFTGENMLIQRKNTRYLSSIIYKCLPF